MGDLGVVVAGFLQLFHQLLAALAGLVDFTVIFAVIDDVLHTIDFFLIDALHAVQIFDAQVTHGVSIPAVHINEGFEAVLLSTVKKPVNGALLVDSDMIFDEVNKNNQKYRFELVNIKSVKERNE